MSERVATYTILSHHRIVARFGAGGTVGKENGTLGLILIVSDGLMELSAKALFMVQFLSQIWLAREFLYTPGPAGIMLRAGNE